MIDYSKVPVEIIKKKDERCRGCEVMELRFYLKENKIVWVEPIDQEKFKQGQSGATGKKYTVSIINKLSEERLEAVSPMAFSHSSPACLFWWVYVDDDGNIEKVCLLEG